MRATIIAFPAPTAIVMSRWHGEADDPILPQPNPEKILGAERSAAVAGRSGCPHPPDLSLLEASDTPSDMDVTGLHFHRLTGNLAGRFAVTVRANWRITFAWDGGDAVEVDYEDYH